MTPAADSPLAQAVVQAFAPGGALHRSQDGYRPREAQGELAMAVAQAVDAQEALVVEAGTGVGKTFGYLVPVLLSGRRALISTATKNLQDQLFQRDLPRLRDALQVPVSTALLKGRSSYLCLHRLGSARTAGDPSDRLALRTLAQVERWAQQTRSGDLAEIEGLNDRSPVIALITSTRENCLGSECPQFRDCHVVKARREALAADVVVVNHHLFFADVALRDGGVAELLPSVEVAVFDEAHQLGEAGVNFMGTQFTTSAATDLARDLVRTGSQEARGLAAWSALASACEQAARAVRSAAAGSLGEVRGLIKLRWEERAGSDGLIEALKACVIAFEAAQAAALAVADAHPDFDRLAERCAEMARRAEGFLGETADDVVRWIDVGPLQARLVQTPLDIRHLLDAQRQHSPKAWIFTSATLGDEQSLDWFTIPAGLGDARTLRVGSPFDYPRQARLYVPRDLPLPNDARHPGAVAALAARLAARLDGRCFVLTTTLRALSAIGEALPGVLQREGASLEVLVQGRAPKRELMARFLDNPRSVLVGSHSFWEGVDVPGDALQCVIIDKLPFPPPNDPLVEARTRRLREAGRSPFDDYHLPEAMVALRQGAGRLIRSETDEGLLVIADARMARMGYGRRLRAALPPMTPVDEESAALQWLDEVRARRASAR